MNLKQAAQQALEALDQINSPLSFREVSRVGVALSALRAALAEDAMQRLADEQQMIERGTKAWADVPDATAWVNEMRGNVPAPTSQDSRQVEPVAWLTRDEQDGLWHPTAFKKTVDDRPLYLAPPKREPLTDEEIAVTAAACNSLESEFLVDFARAIERAHGIGGEE